eukprot:Hpha_TRINITY_DN23861_c0_g1::TRINITY_DN23861_c0_g1_i1::g.109790::m.109790
MSDLRQQLQSLERWLEADKERREILYIVKRSLGGLNSQYSFQREDGLRQLLHLLRELQGRKDASHNWEDPAFLRCDSRTDNSDFGSDPGVTVTEGILRQVFPKTLPPSVPHLCATTPTERRLAMVCLEGLCVLSRREQKAFFAHRGVLTVKDELARHLDLFRPYKDPDLRRAQREQMQSAAAEVIPLLCASLDTLLVACLDSPAAQAQVLDLGLPRELCEVLQNPNCPGDLLYKIIEFLSILLRMCELSYTPESARGPRGDQRPAGERLQGILLQHLGANVLRQLPLCVTVAAAPPGAGARVVNTAKKDFLQQASLIKELHAKAI